MLLESHNCSYKMENPLQTNIRIVEAEKIAAHGWN
jgi:hypothetical protein